ncbi:NADH dehydrogenase [ubiquinone] flavoprotein 3, mitochondrial isoform X1 [Pelobates fuscus]|uniref:NADH dehydrogenase [ubiquinone] flavoprotein 3, mitochondrial isoform X1 n=1 Tax=Pelobates fuscus TaxID=191477 RepID=UPI002FE4BA98
MKPIEEGVGLVKVLEKNDSDRVVQAGDEVKNREIGSNQEEHSSSSSSSSDSDSDSESEESDPQNGKPARSGSYTVGENGDVAGWSHQSIPENPANNAGSPAASKDDKLKVPIPENIWKEKQSTPLIPNTLGDVYPTSSIQNTQGGKQTLPPIPNTVGDVHPTPSIQNTQGGKQASPPIPNTLGDVQPLPSIQNTQGGKQTSPPVPNTLGDVYPSPLSTEKDAQINPRPADNVLPIEEEASIPVEDEKLPSGRSPSVETRAEFDKTPVLEEQVCDEPQTAARQEPETSLPSPAAVSDLPSDNSRYQNLQHYSYTPFTFVDYDVSLAQFRLPQPSSRRLTPQL